MKYIPTMPTRVFGIEIDDLYRIITWIREQGYSIDDIDTLVKCSIQQEFIDDCLDDSLMSEIVLERTCVACPEQYDAFIGNKQVGYLRLRHGYFRVDYPNCGGETIYEATPKGDGIFEEDEREIYLNEAKQAIYKKISEEQE